MLLTTRADAIKNGALVDVTRTAREAGFAIPVALTRDVYEHCIKGRMINAESRRLWALLKLLYHVIDYSPDDGSEEVEMIYKHARLKAVCHAGDDEEPVLTIMESDNDSRKELTLNNFFGGPRL